LCAGGKKGGWWGLAGTKAKFDLGLNEIRFFPDHQIVDYGLNGGKDKIAGKNRVYSKFWVFLFLVPACPPSHRISNKAHTNWVFF